MATRDNLRRYNVLLELGQIYDSAQYQLPSPVESGVHRPAETSTNDPGAAITFKNFDVVRQRLIRERGWTEEQLAKLSEQLDSFFLHERLWDAVAPGYVRFRQALEQVARTHSVLCRKVVAQLKSALATGIATQLLGVDLKTRRQIDRYEADLGRVLAEWRLVPSTSGGALLGPIAAAIALGMSASTSKPPDVPMTLSVPRHAGAGDFVHLVAYHLVDSSIDWSRRRMKVMSNAELRGLGLSNVEMGNGRVAGHDAQWWVIHNIGGVSVVDIVDAVALTSPKASLDETTVRRALAAVDRAICQ